MTPNTAKRLHATLVAVCPILGVSVNAAGNGGNYTAAPSATAAQISAANSALASFDWSNTAQATWDTTQARTEANGNLGTATAGLDAPEYVALRALVAVMADQLNTLRAAVVPAMAPITVAQAKSAIQSKINAGSADT